jgi:hypothetical protein
MDGDGVDRGKRCPVCRIGTLASIAYDQAVGPDAPAQQQSADSFQLEVFTCGHRVMGPSLASADPERLDVERRDSEDTVDPLPDEI